MGAFIIFDIKFEKLTDKTEFEKKYNIRKKDILVDDNTPCFGIAWTHQRCPALNPIYFMGFMGYYEPHDILKDSLKQGIKIKFLAWIPINDKLAKWEKIRGRW